MAALSNKIRLGNMASSKPLVTGDEKIAVFGAGGQIGTKLKPLLEEWYKGKVIYCDAPGFAEKKGMTPLDVANDAAVAEFIDTHNVKVVINLAALLSAAAEEKPELARKINLFAPLHLLETCLQKKVRKVMMMSSMAAQEFNPRPDDTEEMQKMRTYLQGTASTTLLSTPNGDYGSQKVILEIAAKIYANAGLEVYIPRLAGVLNAHTPWPSNGTTEELDKLVVAAAIHEVYGEKWQEELQKRLNKYHPEAAKNRHYLIDGKYVPEAPADAKFDMVDGQTLPEAVLLSLHRNLHGEHIKGEIGPVVNISEYTLGMKEAADILKELNPEFPVRFAQSVEEGLDAGKVKRAKDWPFSQHTEATEKLIGAYKERPAAKSLRDAYNNAVKALQAEKMAEMGFAIASRDGRRSLG